LDTESQKLRLNDIVEKKRKEQHLCIIKKVAKQSNACQRTFMASKTNIFLLLFLCFLFIFSTKTLSATHNLALASASLEAGK